jgi:hypothetical protein
LSVVNLIAVQTEARNSELHDSEYPNSPTRCGNPRSRCPAAHGRSDRCRSTLAVFGVTTPIGTVSGLATPIGVDAATFSSKFHVEALGQLTERVRRLAQLPVLFFQRPHGCQALLQSSVMFIVSHTAPRRTRNWRDRNCAIDQFYWSGRSAESAHSTIRFAISRLR